MSNNNNNDDVDDAPSVSAAELKKEEGNKAFGEQNYEEAIRLYSEAIKLNSKNHLYYSNRSMCYLSTKQYSKAADDAKECLKLNPTFLKAYYRLSVALSELGDYDGAHNAIKQGLGIDPNHSQLLKQLRIINASKKQQKKKSSSPSSDAAAVAASMSTGVGGLNSTDSEMMDLQQQFRTTVRDYNICKANIDKCQREQKIDEITKQELDKLPMNNGDALYRGVGKMFLKSTRDEVDDYITQNMSLAKKKEQEYSSKLEYLEKRLTSQKQNIEELSKAAVSSIST